MIGSGSGSGGFGEGGRGGGLEGMMEGVFIDFSGM